MKNKDYIAGVDEVGRGCLAGPVVSAAVILKNENNLKLFKDSKKVSFKERLFLAKIIKKNSYYAIGIASVKEIEKLNILQASLLSMKRAVKKLKKKPKLVLIDGIFSPNELSNCKTIIRGDEKVKSISAASIVAKVYRDLLMIKLSKKYQNYSWQKNFGYGTKDHINGLKKFGITTQHRRNFKPIYNMLYKKI